MSRETVARARRTQLVSTYGVGSLFPSQDESFMICGLDEWPDRGVVELPEPRLASSLQVSTFRAPRAWGKGDVPVVRFPDMHFCPGCRRLAPHNRFCHWDEQRCDRCARDLTPSRFVAVCEDSHIQDFPYFQWVHAGSGDPTGGDHELKLETRGRTSSLADIQIRCSCGVLPVSMAGSFSPTALVGVAGCKGMRPWLPAAGGEGCSKALRTLQRGSSNVWFPVVRSALSIPPWSEGVARFVQKNWTTLGSVPVHLLSEIVAALPLGGLPAQAVLDAVLERRGEQDPEPRTQAELRSDEYRALVQGKKETSPHQQFVSEDVEVAGSLTTSLDQVADVSRLREVRALSGFTRLRPEVDDSGSVKVASLSSSKLDWLPAVEVLGEGIFLRVSESRLARWESTEFAVRRAALIRHGSALKQSPQPSPGVAPRRLALHALAHAVLKELSLDAGYPTASLRERLFTEPDESGILVYTATADSAGSLGGLSAQSRSDIMARVFTSAIARAGWCSSDPVCIEAESTGADARNLAACHACLLLPETSCELMNNYLDRATLVGTPTSPSAGLFSDLAV